MVRAKNSKLFAAAALFLMVLMFGLVNALSPLIENWYSLVEGHRDICVNEAYAIITYQSYRNVMILDVRSADEFNTLGHVAGAINIEYTMMEANLSDPSHCPLAGHEEDTIIVCCQSGGRSANASAVLASHGFNMVYNMVGGMNAWTDPPWSYPVVFEEPPSYTDISVVVAYDMIYVAQSCNLIVDVRTPSEYDAEHIENAINIPYYSATDFGTRLAPLVGHEEDEIIVYCQNDACSKSPSACQYLVGHGFTKVYNVLGGIDAWKAAGYPVVPESPPPGELVPNPSVEDGDTWPFYWRRGKYSDVTGSHVWSSIGHTGAKSLEVRIDPDPAAVQWHSVYWYQSYELTDPACPLTPGSSYVYRAWFQTKNVSLTLYVGFWDAGGSSIQPWRYLEPLSSPEPSWTLSPELTFTVPANAARVVIGMAAKLEYVDSGFTGEAVVRADDFEVYEVS